MKLLFEKSFVKDISKLNNRKLQTSIEDIIIEVEKTEDFSKIVNTKKIKGYKNYYRIRLGEYRIGIIFKNEMITFVRFMHRKDIYKYFP